MALGLRDIYLLQSGYVWCGEGGVALLHDQRPWKYFVITYFLYIYALQARRSVN